MKNYNFWYAVLMSMAIVGAVFFTACHEKEDPIPPTPPTPQPSIEVTYPSAPSIEGGCTGSGTTEDPLVVGDDTFSATIAETVTSKYLDPDGSTSWSCTSQATAHINVSQDPLFVKNLAELMTIAGHTGSTSVSTEGEKETTKWSQTFTIGGAKDIEFKLSYEKFNHTNSQGKVIPMPYIKLASASYGSVEADEATTAKGIRLRQLTPTRAGTITDSTTFEVTVPFTVGYSSENTEETKSDSLVIEVVFNAVVETVTEIPDPTMDFSCELIGGQHSPFMLTPGETLSLKWKEHISYGYFDIPNRTGMENTYHLEAYAKAYATPVDTIWGNDVSEFAKVNLSDPVVATSDTYPVEHTGSYAFEVAGQKISLDFGYQSYPPFTVEGEEVNLPYLMLKEPEIGNVDVAEVPNGVLVGRKGKLYTIAVTINQELSVVNGSEPKSEQLQYIVKYIGAIAEEEPQPVTLVDIKYSKGLPQWYEAHDNIGLRYDYGLYRDSLFSDGSVRRVETRSGNAEPECKMFNTSPHGDYAQITEIVDGVTVYYFPFKTDKNGESDHNWRQSRKIAVPDISLVTVEKVRREDENPREWTRYHGFDPANPQPGWYWKSFECRNRARLWYNYANGGEVLANFAIFFAWYNNICYVEDGINGGQLIDFLGDENDLDNISYAPQVEFFITEENITMPTGEPAKVFTHTCLAKFISWDEAFPAVLVDTVYQYDPAHPPF